MEDGLIILTFNVVDEPQVILGNPLSFVTATAWLINVKPFFQCFNCNEVKNNTARPTVAIPVRKRSRDFRISISYGIPHATITKIPINVK